MIQGTILIGVYAMDENEDDSLSEFFFVSSSEAQSFLCQCDDLPASSRFTNIVRCFHLL